VLALLGIAGWLAVTPSERRHHASVPLQNQRPRLPLGNGTAWLVSLFFACVNFLFYALVSWTSPMYSEGRSVADHRRLDPGKLHGGVYGRQSDLRLAEQVT
jgi:cyanate permease